MGKGVCEREGGGGLREGDRRGGEWVCTSGSG